MEDKERFFVHARRSFIFGWMHVAWIYFIVGWRFLNWRLHFLYRKREGKQGTMKQTLLIVRHGQTTWNVEHRLPGQLLEVALNDNGRQQAARLADSLKSLPISAIISSPLERAYDTAAYLAQGRNVEIQLEPALMDTQVGRWAGQIIDDIAKNDPAWKEYVKNPLVAPEGVETFVQVQDRVVAAVERWRAQNVGAYPAFVAHADVIKLLIAHYTGLEPARAGSIFIDNASVSLIEFDAEQHAHVVAIGWSPQPGWLKPPISVEPMESDAAQEAGEQKM